MTTATKRTRSTRPRHRATASGRGPVGFAGAKGWAGCRPTRGVGAGATGSGRNPLGSGTSLGVDRPRFARGAPHARPFTDLPKTIGDRLRASRKAQRMTLVELAKSSGVDAATISRVERGAMTGTLESHLKLARALGMKFAELYAGIEDAHAGRSISLQAPGSHSEVYVHQAGKSSLTMLTADVFNKKLMPVLIAIEAGGSTNKEEARVGTEKFLYVVEGELEIKIGQETHTLKKGSSLYFEASLPHQLRNLGAKTARCLAVTTPPAL